MKKVTFSDKIKVYNLPEEDRRSDTRQLIDMFRNNEVKKKLEDSLKRDGKKKTSS